MATCGSTIIMYICMYSCNHTCIITCHFMQTVQLKCLKFNDNYIFSTGNGFTGTRPYSIDNGGTLQS